MAELRALAEAAGYGGIRTYLASGNLILESTQDGSAIEATLEDVINRHFGFHVDVIVRSQQQWSVYAQCNPFSAEGNVSPNLVMICVGKEAATDDDLSSLRARAGANERVERSDDALWLYFGDGSARSKMGNGSSKAVWTTRNLTTVKRLAEMLLDSSPEAYGR